MIFCGNFSLSFVISLCYLSLTIFWITIPHYLSLSINEPCQLSCVCVCACIKLIEPIKNCAERPLRSACHLAGLELLLFCIPCKCVHFSCAIKASSYMWQMKMEFSGLCHSAINVTQLSEFSIKQLPWPVSWTENILITDIYWQSHGILYCRTSEVEHFWTLLFPASPSQKISLTPVRMFKIVLYEEIVELEDHQPHGTLMFMRLYCSFNALLQ